MRRVFIKVLTVIMFAITLSLSFNLGTKAKYVNWENAQSYVLMEASSKRVIAGKNIDERYLTASICKILTAIIVIENYNIDNYVLVEEDTINQVGSAIYLDLGDFVCVRDLLYGLMLRSGNDCAYLLAKSCCGSIDNFVVLMNYYAKKIGMRNSIFCNPSGLDESSCNYSTAYDMALLMAYAMENKTFREITGTTKYSFTTSLGKGYLLYNKHKLITGYDYIIGGKTGYTVAAHRTLVTYAKKDDMQLICVTFDCSDDWNVHLDLFDYGFQNYKMKNVIEEQIIKTKKGYLYTPYIDSDVVIPLKNNENIVIKVYLYENINKDDVILGYLVIYSDDKEIYRKDVIKYL